MINFICTAKSTKRHYNNYFSNLPPGRQVPGCNQEKISWYQMILAEHSAPGNFSGHLISRLPVLQ